jgi:nitrogenase molybdenum-iron protein alpha chain
MTSRIDSRKSKEKGTMIMSGTLNLLEPEVQIREVRLGSITGFKGSASELVNLSRSGCNRDSSRSFSQCMGCSSSTALCQLSMIQDAAVVNHAPIGCSGDFARFNFVNHVGQIERGLPVQQGRYFSTNVNEQDTVFGAVKKLRDTVLEVNQRVKPKAIFVTTSCASGIIGDDVEGTVRDLTKELGIPVVGAFCEGFKSRLWTTGFDSAFHAIVRSIVKPPVRKTNKVNIINFFGSHIFDELLESLGYEANYVVPYCKIEDLEKLSEAAATIQVCSTLGTYLGAALEQEYGVPEIKSPPAYGIAGTDKWMRELGRVLDRNDEVERIIAKEHIRVLPELAKYREKLKGKTAYLTAGAAHGHAIIALLRELGMKVDGAAIFHHDPIYDNGDPTSDALAQTIDIYGDIKNYNVCSKQTYELMNILNKAKPDLLVARHTGMVIWAAKLGIPTFLMDDEQFSFGYQGVLNYAERILDTFATIEFTKNLAKHSTIPYTKWWFQQDPFTFLGGDASVESY